MRTNDIVMGSKPTATDMTPELYMRHNSLHPIPIEERDVKELRRGLCQKSAGNVAVCKTCPGGCCFGKELLRRMESTDEKKNDGS